MSNYYPYHVDSSPSPPSIRQNEMPGVNFLVAHQGSLSSSHSSLPRGSPPIVPYSHGCLPVPSMESSYHQTVPEYSDSGMEPLDLSTKAPKYQSSALQSQRVMPYQNSSSTHPRSPSSRTTSPLNSQHQSPSPTFYSPSSGQPVYYEQLQPMSTPETSFQIVAASHCVLDGMSASNCVSRPYEDQIQVHEDGSESDTTLSTHTPEAMQDEEAPTYTNLDVSTSNPLLRSGDTVNTSNLHNGGVNTTEVYCDNSRSSPISYSSHFSSYHREDQHNARSSPHYHSAMEETNSGMRTQHQAQRNCSPPFQQCGPFPHASYSTGPKLIAHLISPPRSLPKYPSGRSHGRKKPQQLDPDSSSDSGQPAHGVAPSAVPASSHPASRRDQSPPQTSLPTTPSKETQEKVKLSDKENSIIRKITQVPKNKYFCDTDLHIPYLKHAKIVMDMSKFLTTKSCSLEVNESITQSTGQKMMRMRFSDAIFYQIEESFKA